MLEDLTTLEDKYKINLHRLADFLKEDIREEQFDMSHFRMHEGKIISYKSSNDCGTVGCALGWAPLVNGLWAEQDDYTWSMGYRCYTLDFNRYCERVFGISDRYHIAWDVLFSDGWVEIDNTVEGVVQRIRFVADNYEEIDWNMLEDVKEGYSMESMLERFLSIMDSYENG